MLAQGAPVREFSSTEELRAHYRALQARLWSPPVGTARPPEAGRGVTRDLVELQRQRVRRETDEARARWDEQVFVMLDPETVMNEPRRIIARVASAFGITPADVVGPCRDHAVLCARYAAIAAVKAAHPRLTLPRLGRIFGRDHTTILHSLRRIARNGVPQPPAAGDAR